MHKNDRIIELERKIQEANEYYHNTDTPLVADFIYDAWVDELKKLDEDNIVLSQVGNEISDNSPWEKTTHIHPMGSLEKVNTSEQFINWCNSYDDFLVLDKLDGLSVDVKYEKGKLVKASSRGNGLVGEDITRNVLRMIGVKQYLDIDLSFHLRGEIILTKSNHKKYFSDYKNTRNAASGIAKRFDGEGSEHLSVLFYDVIGIDFETELEKLEFIKSLNLNTPRYELATKKSSIDLWQQYQEKIRQSLDYDIDGLVIRINKVSIHNLLGEKNLRPKWAIAFKFDAPKAETIIKDIVLQVGQTGKITPVAVVEPVDLLGATIQRASLYNLSNIKNLGIGIGAKVIISRRNDVIPAVDAVVEKASSPFEINFICPVCNSKTEMQGEYLVCTNIENCHSQRCGRIQKWCDTLGLLGWGTVIVDKLVESNKVEKVSDLYKLSIQDLMYLDRMGERSATKAYNILWENTEIKLDRFLGGLSIPIIGPTTIQLLMDSGLDDLEKILNATEKDFSKISGIGPIKAKSLYEGLKNKKPVIEELLALGIKIKERTKGKFTGMVFVFTGTMVHDRDELIKLVQDNGGTVKNSVVKNTSYLVCEDQSTTKYKEAQKKKIPIITEQQFLDMIE